jgi:hypothetical protein
MTPRQKFSEALCFIIEQDLPLIFSEAEMDEVVLTALKKSGTVIGPRTPNHCPECGERSTTIRIGGPMTAERGCGNGHKWHTRGMVEDGHYRCEVIDA